MSRGIVYVASLAHSGSTLLDLLLGVHPQMVGLGEVSKVLDLDSDGVDENLHMACTCGQRAVECSFWGEFLTELKWLDGNSKKAKYEALIAHFYKQYDNSVQLVDSSKYRQSIATITSIGDVQLRVLHLIKDVRSFCLSHRRSTLPELEIQRLPKLLNSEALSLWLYGHTIKAPSYLFWKWFLRNRSLIRYLDESELSFTSVSYDQLAKDPQHSMGKIFSFLELEPLNSSNLVPAQSKSHIFLGNPMIGDSEKLSAVRYDDRWQQDDDWRLAADIYGAIMDFNQKMVYPQ